MLLMPGHEMSGDWYHPMSSVKVVLMMMMTLMVEMMAKDLRKGFSLRDQLLEVGGLPRIDQLSLRVLVQVQDQVFDLGHKYFGSLNI